MNTSPRRRPTQKKNGKFSILWVVLCAYQKSKIEHLTKRESIKRLQKKYRSINCIGRGKKSPLVHSRICNLNQPLDRVHYCITAFIQFRFILCGVSVRAWVFPNRIRFMKLLYTFLHVLKKALSLVWERWTFCPLKAYQPIFLVYQTPVCTFFYSLQVLNFEFFSFLIFEIEFLASKQEITQNKSKRNMCHLLRLIKCDLIWCDVRLFTLIMITNQRLLPPKRFYYHHVSRQCWNVISKKRNRTKKEAKRRETKR